MSLAPRLARPLALAALALAALALPLVLVGACTESLSLPANTAVAIDLSTKR